MKEKLVRMFRFADDKIAAILVSNPYLVYVITKDNDGYYYLSACQTADNVSRICLKCGTYDEMFACAKMLCNTTDIFCYDVK